MSSIVSDGEGGFAGRAGAGGGRREFGFYPTSAIWAGSPASVSPGTNHWQFKESMEEEVFQYKCESFSLRVCRDGLMLFEVAGLANEWPAVETPETIARWWGKYMEVVNCAHLLLDASVLEEMRLSYGQFAEVTRRDALIFRFTGSSVTSMSGSLEGGVGARFRERYLSMHSSNDGMSLFHRQVLHVTVFKSLAAKLETAIQDSSTVRYLATIARGLSQYKIGNYQVSLVLAWFVVESILFAKWKTHLESLQQSLPDGEKRIKKDRMEGLEGRDYPASVVTNLLELDGRIDFEVFKRIDRTRRVRNKVVHQEPGFECRAEHCREALQLAVELVTEGERFTCPLNLSYSVSS